MTDPAVQTSTSPVAKRRWAAILFIGAIAALATAFVQLHAALVQAVQTADDFIMPGFLLIVGLMLLAASRAVRRPSTVLTLPPEGPPTA
ncbi:hypothetical protein [Bordetella sp. FB-8]|uniref:hypothetical protein n=1 Tax=Bordetella sp. FB-8 TaxID=1159870 RepID=UPI00036AC860|nr:hypothetical protein [Bordetella sp. FB-8]